MQALDEIPLVLGLHDSENKPTVFSCTCLKLIVVVCFVQALS